jgi:hypothetical protein
MNIRGVWVIDEAGLCLFHRTFGEPLVDNQKISALVTALYYFSTELPQNPKDKSKHLQHFKWGNYYFYIQPTDGIKLLVCTDAPLVSSNMILKHMSKAFSNHFKGSIILFSEMLSSSPEATKIRQAFSADLESIIRDYIKTPLYPSKMLSLDQVMRKHRSELDELVSLWGEAIVLVYLNVDGRTSLPQIATSTNLSETQVRNFLEILAEKGWVNKKPAHDLQSQQGISDPHLPLSYFDFDNKS